MIDLTSKIHIEIISEKPVDNRLNDRYVKNWMQQIGNARTKNNYAREFPRFLDFVNKSPSEIIKSRLQHLTSQDISKRQYWEQQVIKYMHSLEKDNLRVATIHGYLRSVQSFFSHNGVKLQFARGQLKAEPTEEEKTSRKWVLINEEVRVVYRHCKTARDRTLLLVAYQSGFLPADIENMKIENFRFYDDEGKWKLDETEHYYHYQMREKTNQYQCTMISCECISDIKMMLKEREYPKNGSLFIGMTKKKEGLKAREINDVMKRIIKRAYPKRIGEFKTKNLRDSYDSALLAGHLQSEIKDLMMGHKRKGARNAYGSPESLEPAINEAYKRIWKFLAINGFGSTSHKLDELKAYITKKLEHQDFIIEQQQTTIQTLQQALRDILKSKGKIT